MPDVILFNKPYGVLSQFTDRDGRPTIADFVQQPGFYAAGRLDHDSEGLLVLCDDGALQQRIASPHFKLPKTYLVQVEGEADESALARLRSGVVLNDGPARADDAQRIEVPALWPREPPVRYRASIPTSWISLTLSEGRNRQVRRMSAAVGFPTLRLVRWRIGPWSIEGLASGAWRREAATLPGLQQKVAARSRPRRPGARV